MFISAIIFLSVLFIYIHIMAQYRKSQDMEVYQADFSGNAGLQEICDVRQPVVVDIRRAVPDFFRDITLSKFLYSGAAALVAVRDIGDYSSDAPVDDICLPFKTATAMFNSDADARFFSDENYEFAEDADMRVEVDALDGLLQPQTVIKTQHDVMLGSRGAHTPLRWSATPRHFIVVCQGRVHVKMTPYKSEKYLHTVSDYATMEFRSEIDVWAPQERFVGDIERVKFLEFDVSAGSALYVPPYWWYSIRYSDSEDSLLLGYKYHTVFSCVANAGNLARWALQRQNTVARVERVERVDAEKEAADAETEDEPVVGVGAEGDAQ
jgi:hypothetical protein